MINLCFYFQVHQPYRLRSMKVKDIGGHSGYFDDDLNREVFHKVAAKCYWPAGKMYESLIKKWQGRFRISFSFSGTFLQQCAEYDPDLFRLYQHLLEQDGVDLLCETSHHTLASLEDEDEFCAQVNVQRETLWKTFRRRPKVFRNTELIYDNRIGELVAKLGFAGCLLEGWEKYLPPGWNGDHVFHHHTLPYLKLLPKNYRLSDDIAFRFSNRAWNEWPLTAEKYFSWLEALRTGAHEFIGLFMDYETFGEHQWADTGIFSFIDKLVEIVCESPGYSFVTVSEAVEKLPARAPMSVINPLSWADVERDVSAWLGNELQNEAFQRIYTLKPYVLQTGDSNLIEEWRKLQTSDYFYYMCIKYSADGDVHKYFSPCESPYSGFLDYMKVIDDFEIKVMKKVSAKVGPILRPSQRASARFQRREQERAEGSQHPQAQ